MELEEQQGRAKVANFSNIIPIFYIIMMLNIFKYYEDNKCDSKQTVCFSNTFSIIL